LNVDLLLIFEVDYYFLFTPFELMMISLEFLNSVVWDCLDL